MGINLCAQETTETELQPYSFDDKKWGYFDGTKWDLYDDWDVLIQPKYDEAFPFYDGLARVKEDNKFGYIDKNGEYVIPPIYDLADDFSGGLAIVTSGNEYFMINTKGYKQDQKNPVRSINLYLPAPLPNYGLSENGLSLLRLKFGLTK